MDQKQFSALGGRASWKDKSQHKLRAARQKKTSLERYGPDFYKQVRRGIKPQPVTETSA